MNRLPRTFGSFLHNAFGLDMRFGGSDTDANAGTPKNAAELNTWHLEENGRREKSIRGYLLETMLAKVRVQVVTGFQVHGHHQNSNRLLHKIGPLHVQRGSRQAGRYGGGE